ncbi:hypothetical protein V8F33_006845 [Rhypophila sp. PSN 637]
MASKPVGTRWAPVSASRNAEKSYKLRCHEEITPEQAYAYVCWCELPFETEDPDSDDDDEYDDDSDGSLAKSWSDTDSEAHGDEDEVIEEKGDKPKKSLCDGGVVCLCGKPAIDHPDHPFITTAAARIKVHTQHSMMMVRCPDNFDMHTFNDHTGLGAKELLENLVLDFIEAEGNWREQWVVCETLAFVMDDDWLEALMGIESIDDSVGIWQIYHLVARRLEHLGLLSTTSEVRNLGLIMSLFMKLAADNEANVRCLEVGGDKTPFDKSVKLTLADGRTTTYKYSIESFDRIIFMYLKKYAIPPADLPGDNSWFGILDDDWDENKNDYNSDVDDEMKEFCLPGGTKEDPFGLNEAVKAYVETYGRQTGGPNSKAVMGGDKYDITPMSVKERKAASLTGKDPLSRKEIKSLKEGMVPGWEGWLWAKLSRAGRLKRL